MLNLVDKGLWTFVTPEGSQGLAELSMLESFLRIPVPEGESHPWASDADGMMHFLHLRDTDAYYPRGFTPEILLRLAQHRVQYRHYPDHRWSANFDNSGWEHYYGKLRNDQQRWACQQMWTHREGLAKLFTRFGKSYVVAAAWVAQGRPQAAFVAPTAAILTQIHEELSEFLDEEVGYVCSSVGKEPKIRRLTGVSLPSVLEGDSQQGYQVREQYREWVQGLEAVYWDEAHMAGERALVFHLWAQNRMIQWGMSATPFTKDSIKDRSLVGFTGPVRIEMDAKAGAEMGLIADMHVRWYDVRFMYEALCADKEMQSVNFPTYYKRLLVTNHAFNEHIASVARHHVQHGDPVIIFVERVEHGKALASLLSDIAVPNVGNVPQAKREQIKADFNEGRIPCVIVTKRWREGVTLKTNVIINAEGMRAEHIQEQRFGRGLMLKEDGRPMILYEYFFHDAPRGTLTGASVSRRALYREQGWKQDTVGELICEELSR